MNQFVIYIHIYMICMYTSIVSMDYIWGRCNFHYFSFEEVVCSTVFASYMLSIFMLSFLLSDSGCCTFQLLCIKSDLVFIWVLVWNNRIHSYFSIAEFHHYYFYYYMNATIVIQNRYIITYRNRLLDFHLVCFPVQPQVWEKAKINKEKK